MSYTGGFTSDQKNKQEVKSMKKLLVLLSAFLLIFTVSCDNSTTSPSTPDTPDVPVVTPPSEEETQPILQDVLDSLNTIETIVNQESPVDTSSTPFTTVIKDASGNTVYTIVGDELTVYRDISAPEFPGVVLKAGSYKVYDGGKLEGVEPDEMDRLNDMVEFLMETNGWIDSSSETTIRKYENVEIGDTIYNITMKLIESYFEEDIYSYEYTLSASYKGIDHFIRYENWSVFPEKVTYTIIGGEYEGNYTTEIASH